MTHIKEIFDLAKLLVEGRRPIDVKLLIHGNSLPVLLLKITNITKDYPVYVNQVRAHYGRSNYNHSFLLSPYDKVEIKPKNTQTFQLGYDGCRIQRHRIASSVPTLNTPPSFSSPADLFRAIANGNPRDSWVEVDFNEFTNKRFARGRLKSILQEMLRMGQNSCFPARPPHLPPRLNRPTSLCCANSSHRDRPCYAVLVHRPAGFL